MAGIEGAKAPVGPAAQCEPSWLGEAGTPASVEVVDLAPKIKTFVDLGTRTRRPRILEQDKIS